MTNRRPSSSRRREMELADERSGSQRLQKVLAAAGLGSRRDCESLISEGRVEIDRQMVTELGTKVDPLTQEIRVDGVSLHRPKRIYFALNKPPGVICTNFDPSQRMRVIDLIPTEERVFPVGRLDRGSEGLIIVTNDGELANRVTHPRYGLEKTYFVRVAGNPSDEELLKLRHGVRLAEGVARVVGLKVKKRYRQHTDMEIVLNEGKNREIRRILAKVGHKVMLLRRTAVGPIRLADLPVGASRRLLAHEVEQLFEATTRRRLVEKHKSSKAAAEKVEPANTAKKLPSAPKAKSPPIPSEAKGSSSYTSGPPKIDLAALLNPSSAPKSPILVTPPSAISATAPIGDILAYENAQEDSLPAYTASPASKKPKRGLAEKLAAEREAAPAFLSPRKKPEQEIEAPSALGEGQLRGKKPRFAVGAMPRALRSDARNTQTSGKPARRGAGKSTRSAKGARSTQSERFSKDARPGKSSRTSKNPRSGRSRGR